jgi:hypothetical protein
MQSQYGSPSQAAALALEYVGVSTPLTMTETIVVFVTFAIASISDLRSRNFLSSPFLYACIDVFPGFKYNGMTDKHKKHTQQNSAPVRRCNYVR